MGQQQILLVILVVVVVGVATIVATNVISQGNEQANRDAIRQDLMSAASTVQHIWERPYMLGGGGRDFTENNFTDERLTEIIQIPGNISGNTIVNENATYTISVTGSSTVEIEAVPNASDLNMEIIIERDPEDGWIYTLDDGISVITNQPAD